MMKTALIVLSLISLVLISFFAKQFFSRFKVGFYYIDKYEEAVHEAIRDMVESSPNYIPPIDYYKTIDLRGTPTHKCLCGSEVWMLKVAFSDYEISNYFLDMECFNCGNLATAPTPIDRGIND